MNNEEKREKNRVKVANWRRKNAGRLAVERAAKRIAEGDGRAKQPTLYRLIELVNSAGVPVQCLVVKEGQAYVIPAGLTKAKVLLPESAMARKEAHAFKRMWREMLNSWGRGG